MSTTGLSVFWCLQFLLKLFLRFSLLGSFIFLVRFIHSYSLFETHRISFSASLLLVYGKAVDTCVLILHLVICLSGCIGSKIFLVEAWRYFKYMFMSSTNRETWTSFAICISLVSLYYRFHWDFWYCKDGEGGYLGLTSEIGWNAFSVLPFSVILAIDLSWVDFIILCSSSS